MSMEDIMKALMQSAGASQQQPQQSGGSDSMPQMLGGLMGGSQQSTSSSLGGDILNLTNHTSFGAPNTNPTNRDFGRVTGQQGASRTIQITARLEF